LLARFFLELSTLSGQPTTSFSSLPAYHRRTTPLEYLRDQIRQAESGWLRAWQLLFAALDPLMVDLWVEMGDEQKRLYLRSEAGRLFGAYLSYIPLVSWKRCSPTAVW